MRFEFLTTREAYYYTIKFLCENLSVSTSVFYPRKKTRGARRDKEQREYELVRKVEALKSQVLQGELELTRRSRGFKADIVSTEPSVMSALFF